MFLFSFRRQNKAHGRRIQPATEADSNQLQDSVSQPLELRLLNGKESVTLLKMLEQ